MSSTLTPTALNLNEHLNVFTYKPHVDYSKLNYAVDILAMKQISDSTIKTHFSSTGHGNQTTIAITI